MDTERDRVRPAVIVALKLEIFGASRVTPGQSQRHLVDLRAGRCVSNRAFERDRTLDHLCDFQLKFHLSGEHESVTHVPCNGIHNEIWCVTEYVWTHAHYVIDVFVAIHVPHQAVLGALEPERNGQFGAPNLTANAAGDHLLGTVVERLAFIESVQLSHTVSFRSRFLGSIRDNSR